MDSGRASVDASSSEVSKCQANSPESWNINIRTCNDVAQATVQVHQPCAGFHLFPLLPCELRLKIWEYNLPQERVVEIRCGARNLKPPSPYGNGQPGHASAKGCTSSAPIPANLHTCCESRNEARKRYKLMFGIARQPGRIFFDPARDILYFGVRNGYLASESQFSTVMSLVDPAELARVRRLAVNDALLFLDKGRGPYTSVVAANLTVELFQQVRQRLHGLRELIFVPRDNRPLLSPQEVAFYPPYAQYPLHRQIRAAIDAVREKHRDWQVPSWTIDVLAMG